MIENNPKVTVLMAVYNGDQWISYSIESVLNQSFKDFELLIVDDGSVDSTRDIVKKYQEIDSRIRYESKVNSGLSDSLNLGIELARADWIARIDADDLCQRDRLQKQYDFSLKNPEVILIGSGMNLIDQSGAYIKEYSNLPQDHEALLLRLISGRSFFSHSSAFINRASLVRVKGYRTKLRNACDTDLWIRLSEVGNIAFLPDILVSIRVHDSQMSNNESGLEQLVEAYLSRVSYWTRRNNCIDPLNNSIKNDLFDEIKSRVKQELSDQKIFIVRKRVDLIKEKIRIISFGNFISTLLIIIKYCPDILIHLKWKYFGEKHSQKMANEVCQMLQKRCES